MKTYKIKINGNDYEVAVEKASNDLAQVVVNGIEYNVEIDTSFNKVNKPLLSPVPGVASSAAPAPSVTPTSAPVSGGASEVKAPLPGTVIDIYVSEGASVNAGDKLMMLEAMKMENNIEAETSGVVKKIHVTKGSSVLEGEVLISIG